MQNSASMLTEKSIELDHFPGRQHQSKPAIAQNSLQLVAAKISHHLAFMETEFARNVEWQRHLISEISACPSDRAKQKEDCSCNCFKLTIDEQEQLRLILGRILKSDNQDLPLKQMIKIASSMIRMNNPEISFQKVSPLKQKSSEKLQFPAVPRVLTLNDLAPSTQRNISTSPPSLPPRTPKAQHQAKKQNKQNSFFTFTPHQQEKSKQLFSRGFQSEERQFSYCGNKEEVLDGDSLGKRLFEESKSKGQFIYIQDSGQHQLIDSEVSLTLSISKKQKRGDGVNLRSRQSKNNSIEYVLQSGQILHESIYFAGADRFQEAKKAWCPQKRESSIEGLRFKEFPKRKIGKCVIKKQNIFAYQGASSGKIRKMHDSFGEAYQQYYLAEGSINGGLFRYHNSKVRQIQ